jgi:ribosomal protein S18 acetylase RimI-like enzyme
MLRLRPLRPDDLARVAALANELVAGARPWTEAQARAQLLGSDRAQGAHVRIAVDVAAGTEEAGAEELVGVAGWVAFAAEAGEFYGSPVLARHAGAARALLAHVAGEARAAGARWLRVGAAAGEVAKRAALEEAGFARVFDFVELALELDGEQAGPARRPLPLGDGAPPPELEEIPFGLVDFERLADLHRVAIAADAPNAPAPSPALLAEAWGGEAIAREATAVLADRAGDYVALLQVERAADDEAVVELVGVHPRWRRRGVARWLLGRVCAFARREGRARVAAVVASSNAASLRLFASIGARERGRREIWELPLDAAHLR